MISLSRHMHDRAQPEQPRCCVTSSFGFVCQPPLPLLQGCPGPGSSERWPKSLLPWTAVRSAWQCGSFTPVLCTSGYKETRRDAVPQGTL